MLNTRDEILAIAYGVGKIEYPHLKKEFYKWLIRLTMEGMKQELPVGTDGLPTTETAEVRRFNERIQQIMDGVI